MVWYRERPIRHSHRVRQASSRCLKAPDVSKLRPCATRTPPLTLPADWAAPGHGQHSQQSLGLVQRPLRGRSVRVHARRPRDQPGRATQAATLDRMRAALRTRHYSRRTEETYVAWIRRYILFHALPPEAPPRGDGGGQNHSLLELAGGRREGGRLHPERGAQRSAVPLPRRLELDLPWLDGVVRAKRPQRLPVVLTRDEVRAVLQPLIGDAAAHDIPALLEDA